MPTIKVLARMVISLIWQIFSSWVEAKASAYDGCILCKGEHYPAVNQAVACYNTITLQHLTV